MRFGRVALAALGIGVGVAGVMHSGARLKAEVMAMRAAQFAASGQWPLAHATAERAVAMNPGEYRYLERVAEAERLRRADVAQPLRRLGRVLAVAVAAAPRDEQAALLVEAQRVAAEAGGGRQLSDSHGVVRKKA